MPHKRAKGPAREGEKAQRATDLAPKISTEPEPIPASVSRVLDAEKIRREYREKKRRLDGVSNSNGDNSRHKKGRHGATQIDTLEDTALRIRSGETITQFNRRVESCMVPLIKTALQQSSALTRKVRREEAAQEIQKQGRQRDRGRLSLREGPNNGLDPPPTAANEVAVNPWQGVKEFQVVPTSAPRRLNDIAQEPPVIKKVSRGAMKNDAALTGVLSMAQRAMMEEERDKAVKRYRELKARKLRESGGVRFDERLEGSQTDLP